MIDLIKGNIYGRKNVNIISDRMLKNTEVNLFRSIISVYHNTNFKSFQTIYMPMGVFCTYNPNLGAQSPEDTKTTKPFRHP